MTKFQNLCYHTLINQVPSGRVITYGGLAKLIDNPKAARAVGSAMNKNPDAPRIPCHRVVKSNGDIGGFADNITIKIKRLKAENIEVVGRKIVNFNNTCITATSL